MVAQVLLAKIVAGTVAVLATLRGGLGLYAWKETEKLERPSYAVIQRLENGVEIRKYDPYMIAETTVDGVGFREPTSSGFRECAGYIFGKNKKKNPNSWSITSLLSSGRSGSGENEKMAMTAPVRVAGQTTTTTTTTSSEKMAMTAPVRVAGGGAKNTKVSFVIGKQYTKRTAPVPLSKNVKLREIPSHTLAVRTFSGPPPKDDRVVRERAILDQTLAGAGMSAKSDTETLVYGYHDPFITPNILRRNEVAVLIEGSI